ncbi:Non-structural maintenance of chromosomes element 4A [Abeliophyllum distichum]|uniref:Non-structural maintenance of chromosomes element 4 n=1 Tax=Abeliophyllum distichum TaxID=126358 RepID=A0ABD1PUK1_9LAMI
MVRAVKRESINNRGNSSRGTRTSAPEIDEASGAINNSSANENCDSGEAEASALKRRVLRSKYLTVKNRISDEKDDISNVDSDKFKSIIEEVDSLHLLVQKPREQVADAEALFDITNTLVTSVKAYTNEGVTPSDFVSCLLRDFGQQGGPSSSQDEGRNSIRWKDIGLAVSHVFRSAYGSRTMIGPMNTELKQRKNVVPKKRSKPFERAQPEELDGNASEEKTDTDKNMATMFDILRKNRIVHLENLILNRNSFAQTVENLFALSFLVKDGRAEIKVDEKGCHRVTPKNAPAANAVQAGDVTYTHFIFRFDFRDWKLMLSSVAVGEELMPHRNMVNISSCIQPSEEPEEAQTALPTTPIRKLSRNRGLVTIVEDSPQSGDLTGVTAIRKGKRKLQ